MLNTNFARASEKRLVAWVVLEEGGMNNLIFELQELVREFTYSNGIFELDENHRIVIFQYPTEFNMSIVNMDTEISVSTSKDPGWWATLAKDGFIYMYMLGRLHPPRIR